MTTDGELDSTFCSQVDQRTGRVLRRSERLLKLKELQSSQDIFADHTEAIPLNQQEASQSKSIGESSQKKRCITASQCSVPGEAPQKKRAKALTQNAETKEETQLESSQSKKPLLSSEKKPAKRSHKKQSKKNAIAVAAPATTNQSAPRQRVRRCKSFAMPQLQCYNDNALLRAPFLHRPQQPQQSFLPTAYPHYFQEQFHSEPLPQTRPPPPPALQMHAQPRLPTNPMDAGYVLTPETSVEHELEHILNTTASPSSTLSMPESLRGAFETDNLRELLRIDPVLYRLTDRHVQALAYALRVDEEQLRRLIRGIISLPPQFIEQIGGYTEALMDEVLEGILTQTGEDTPLEEDALLRDNELLRQDVLLGVAQETERNAPPADHDDDDSSVVSVSPLHCSEMRLFSSQLQQQQQEKRQRSQIDIV